MRSANWRQYVRLICPLLLLAISAGQLQSQERLNILARARGTSAQSGQLVEIRIIIEQFSTREDQKALVDAFTRSGQTGLRDALEKMSAKGRISRIGSVGNDIKYIFEVPSTKGRHFRLLTDRNLAFGELYTGTRSSDYDVGGAELILTPDGKGSGTLLPACRLKLNKKKEIEMETFQNPWNLTNLVVSK